MAHVVGGLLKCSLQLSACLSSAFRPSVIPQLQLVRNARRSCFRRPWHTVRVNERAAREQAQLTPENSKFLQKAFLADHEDQFVSSPLKDGPWLRNQWTMKTLRTGVLALKIGVVPQWTKTGEKFYTTLLQILDNHVIRYIPPERFNDYPRRRHFNLKENKYGNVVVGALSCLPFQFTNQYCGLFKESGLPPKRKLTSFLVTPDAAVQPGTPLYASHFRVGDYVDVQAKTIGHGFQGVVKRWGFKGGPASHGTTKWHRRPGNIGGGRGKGKVWKGRKLPGHMGMEWRMQRGLKIWRINTKYNILYVHGPATPGPTHCYVRVMDSALLYRRQQMVERCKTDPLPMPTFYPDDVNDSLPEEVFDKDLFQFVEQSICYPDETVTKAKAKVKSNK